MGQVASKIFTASGSWTAPAGVYRVTVIGCGGGGGGGSSQNGGTTTSLRAVAGGGGGAAPLGTYNINVVPGTTYTITIGAGGAGGTAPPGSTAYQVGGNGGNGGDTDFDTLIRFYGASGGSMISAGALGGLPNKGAGGAALRRQNVIGSQRNWDNDQIAGSGGHSGDDQSVFSTTQSIGTTVNPGIAAAAAGTNVSTRWGGNAGGPGASSWVPGSLGGASNAGGNANGSGVGFNGTAGNPGTGFGSGGSGASAPGCGSTGVALGAAGGAGAPGVLILEWVEV